MDFFERQDMARRRTKVLVFYFALAVLFTVLAVNAAVYVIIAVQSKEPATLSDWAVQGYWVFISSLTVFVIMCGTLVRMYALRGGGRALAEMVNARRITASTNDPKERQLINVAEEMSIASGMPVPEVYVMDDEAGINAFVAGYTPTETTLVVTKGALDKLDRDELQGVVGHEYSHIFNGDMRLNLKLIGIIAGILALGQIGYFTIRVAGRGGGKKGAGLFVFGAMLFIIGYAGLFFGRLIKAAISRQRELLADASSVQYTRNPSGLADALLEIKKDTDGTLLKSRFAEDMSHMCFAESVSVFFESLFATHPPIEERIKAILPSALLKMEPGAKSAQTMASAVPEAASGFAGGGGGAGMAAAGISASVGNVSQRHVEHAVSLRESMPSQVVNAIRTPRGAKGAVYLLLLPDGGEWLKPALNLIHEKEGDDLMGFAIDNRGKVQSLGPQARLPLFDMAVPALKELPAAEVAGFMDTTAALIELDKKTTPFECALHALLSKYLVNRPKGADKVMYKSLRDASPFIGVLMSAVAHAGDDDSVKCGASYDKAMQSLGITDVPLMPAGAINVSGFGAALRRLAAMSAPMKKELLDALVVCIECDGQVTTGEGELLRAISINLDCPMPPMV